MTRREKLLNGLDLSHTRGIEIGPLMSPIVQKDESEIYYVDHADREALQEKYSQDPNVDIQKLVGIDAVWGDRTLRECFPDAGNFDYVIASHVVEHVPDFLGWLCEIAEVLRPGGRLILAIPDKRYTFDYLRQLTRVSEIVDAYLRRNRRPMPAQLFDHNANSVEVDMVAAWEGRIDPQSLKHYVNLRYALDRSLESIQDEKYVDAHCWVFTPSSLAAILVDLLELDLLPYTCVQLYETERNTNEMLLILERWHDGSPAEKAKARTSFLVHVQNLAEVKPIEEVKTVAVQCCQQSSELDMDALNQKMEAANDEIALLQNQVHALESQITAMSNSRSFQITRPLREFRAWVRSIKQRSQESTSKSV